MRRRKGKLPNRPLDKTHPARYTKQAVTKQEPAHIPNQVIKFPRSRGDSGALYLQSAPAGVMPCLGQVIAELPCVSGVDVWVLRNGNL